MSEIKHAEHCQDNRNGCQVGLHCTCICDGCNAMLIDNCVTVDVTKWKSSVTEPKIEQAQAPVPITEIVRSLEVSVESVKAAQEVIRRENAMLRDQNARMESIAGQVRQENEELRKENENLRRQLRAKRRTGR